MSKNLEIIEHGDEKEHVIEITSTDHRQELVSKNKIVVIDYYTQWCGPCKMMMSRTFTNQQVIDYINGNYYAVKFDAESANPVEFKGKTFSNPGWKQNVRGRNSTHELSRALGVNAYPTLVYMDENADIIAPISGYKTPPQLEMYLKFFVDQYNGDIAQEEWEAYRDNFQPSFQ